MSKKSFFGNNITPACLYCENGKALTVVSDKILCSLKGMVSANYSCRSYIYDPTKRVPNVAPRLDTAYKKEDFKI